MTESATELVVRKSVRVRRAPDAAFELFTRGIGTWWPTETHAIHGDRVAEVVFEERVGGEIYEVSETGQREHWATVREWDPPRRIVLEWNVNPHAVAATEIEVAFVPDGDGTRVELKHRGWERLGGDAAESFDEYDGGWTHVLGKYEAAGAA